MRRHVCRVLRPVMVEDGILVVETHLYMPTSWLEMVLDFFFNSLSISVSVKILIHITFRYLHVTNRCVNNAVISVQDKGNTAEKLKLENTKHAKETSCNKTSKSFNQKFNYTEWPILTCAAYLFNVLFCLCFICSVIAYICWDMIVVIQYNWTSG
jgi:hypothetical protein